MPAVPETDTPSTPTQPAEDRTREWEPGLDVKTGDKLTYKGVTYTVRQPHTTAAHWLPDTLPALYLPA